MRAGRMVVPSTHKALVARSGRCAELYRRQFRAAPAYVPAIVGAARLPTAEKHRANLRLSRPVRDRAGAYREDQRVSVFTPAEIAYLRSQRLGRLATVNADGEPHVVPVGFRYNAEHDTIDIGGRGMGRSRKFRDAARYGRVAFVVDDVEPPGQVRGVEVRGRTEVLTEGGQEVNPNFDPQFIRIKPTRIVSWGIETDAFHPNNRVVG